METQWKDIDHCKQRLSLCHIWLAIFVMRHVSSCPKSLLNSQAVLCLVLQK